MAHSTKTLRSTLLLIIGIPLFCFAFLIIYLTYQESRQQAIDKLTNVLTERTARQAATLNLFFGKMSRYADTISTTLSALDQYTPTIYMPLLHTMLDFEGISSAVIALENDEFSPFQRESPYLILDDNRKVSGLFSKSQYYDFAYHDWFLLPKLAYKGMWTDPYFSSFLNTMICSYGAPFTEQGKFQGVVALSIQVNDITNLLQSINIEGSQLILLSHVGTIVVHPNEDYILRHTFVSLAHEFKNPKILDFAYSLRNTTKTGVVRMEQGLLSENEYIAYAPIPYTNWVLLSVIPESVALTPLLDNAWTSVSYMLLISIMLFGILYYLSQREIITPLLCLKDAAEQLATGNLTLQVYENSKIFEINRLEHTFNHMVVQLRKSLDNEITAARARLYAEEASRAKSEFVARMSHEIRTPMNAIMGHTYLALEQHPEPAQKSFLLKIQQAGKNMLNIINDILDFSKIEAGKLELESVPFSIQDVAQSTYDMFAGIAQNKGLEFILILDDTLPKYVQGDPLRVTQILINLCNNALKFTRSGSITLSITLEATQASSCRLHLCVQDTGIGISPEAQQLLFKEFSQADSSVTRKYGGTGLGLAICRLLTELMSGSITLESTLGEGSSFHVHIPFQQVTPDQISANTQTPSVESALPLPANARILVAEDNEINQEIIVAFLENMGLFVQVAANGLEVLEALANNKPYALILMDLQMPEMDGITATLTLREQGFTLPVIAVSANAMQADIDQCKRAGMNAHIAKPIDPQALHAILSQYLQSA